MIDETQFDDQTKRELERINAALATQAKLREDFPLIQETVEGLDEALKPPGELHLDKEYAEMTPAQRKETFAERLRAMEQRDADIGKHFFDDDALPNSPKRTMAMFVDEGQAILKLDDTYYKEQNPSGE